MLKNIIDGDAVCKIIAVQKKLTYSDLRFFELEDTSVIVIKNDNGTDGWRIKTDLAEVGVTILTTEADVGKFNLKEFIFFKDVVVKDGDGDGAECLTGLEDSGIFNMGVVRSGVGASVNGLVVNVDSGVDVSTTTGDLNKKQKMVTYSKVRKLRTFPYIL